MSKKNTERYKKAISLGKYVEHMVAGRILNEGLDVYLPMIDYRGVDLIVRREDGSYIEVQVKSRSISAVFAGIHFKPRKDYYFVFYSEELMKESHQVKRGEEYK